MRFLDIDLERPDFQTLRAAQELIDDNHAILFPGEAGMLLLKRFSAARGPKPGQLPTTAGHYTETLYVAEDFDLVNSASYGIPVLMAEVAKNRAFHTLLQLCDGPLLAVTAEDTREEASIAHAEVEYAFWPLH